MSDPLDPDVEAAIETFGKAYFDYGFDRLKPQEVWVALVDRKNARLSELRTAIRTACVAAERRGIERAADLCEHYGDVAAEDHEAGACYRLRELLLALPVPESTEAGHE